MTSRFIIGAWTVFTTAAALLLSINTYRDGAALDRLDAREKLDEFMSETRNNYKYRCIEENQTLLAVWQNRYDLLVDIAKVDTSKPPYDLPCRKYAPPNAPVVLSVNPSKERLATQYPDWKSFIKKDDKKAVIWIDDIPILLNIYDKDYLHIESLYKYKESRMRSCENREKSKKENSFIPIRCFYRIDKGLKINLYSQEEKK